MMDFDWTQIFISTGVFALAAYIFLKYGKKGKEYLVDNVLCRDTHTFGHPYKRHFKDEKSEYDFYEQKCLVCGKTEPLKGEE